MFSIPDWYSKAVEQFPNSILLETGLPDEENRFSYLFLEPLQILVAYEPEALVDVLGALDLLRGSGLFAAGYLSYECGSRLLFTTDLLARDEIRYPLAWFGVYRRPFIFDHYTGAQLEGNGPHPHVSAATHMLPHISNFSMECSRSDYLTRIRSIREYIEKGDCYQVNLTARARFSLRGPAAGLYRQLVSRQHARYCAFLHLDEQYILSLSPELFFRIANDNIVVRPMKGTARRGKTAEEDAVLGEWLHNDEKNRSENIMIVDLMRSDLGRIAQTGSVKATQLFGVERYETLYQMTSTVAAQLRPNLGWQEIFHALFPRGSVTGAPKLRTMEIIRELETSPRGVYTGAIGFIGPRGNAVFNVPIRTLVLQDGHGTIGVGSGITYDSIGEEEYAECLLKLRFLADPETLH